MEKEPILYEEQTRLVVDFWGVITGIVVIQYVKDGNAKVLTCKKGIKMSPFYR